MPFSASPRTELSVKKILILPTLCTLGNAVCGLAALVFAAHVSVAAHYNFSRDQAAYISGLLVFLAMIFDVLDGYLARRTKSASQFGAELDSLCDAISFGVVPGFLLIRLGDQFEGRLFKDLFLAVALLYMCCAVLRLARYNVQTTLDIKSHRSFQGLPSPGAAGCIAALVTLRYNFSDIRWVPDELINSFFPMLAPFVGVAAALLMVSRVPYPHLANRVLHRRQRFSRIVQVVLILFGVYLFRELALAVLFWGFAAAGPLRLALRRTASPSAAQIELPAPPPK